MQGLNEVNVNGRRKLFKFDDPQDTRPARLASNLKGFGEYCEEWRNGIGGNLPAKNFVGNTGVLGDNDRSRFSRRLPIYQLLESLVTYKQLVPAAAFRLLEKNFHKWTMTRLSKHVREHGPAGTLPTELRVPNFKWELQACRKVGKRKRSTFRGTANTAVYVGEL